MPLLMETRMTDKQNDHGQCKICTVLARAAAAEVDQTSVAKVNSGLWGSPGRFTDLLFARLLVSKSVSFILILT